ncbi:zinc finger CCCH domain-containing protein 38 isoform X2 [Arachis hypogaea]|uniref:zinc finger CCCH domain-containing protein 38 isoform X2 n=2 Tax=Arachis hypogaea TaxID=3818 RepID=UPI003B223564
MVYLFVFNSEHTALIRENITAFASEMSESGRKRSSKWDTRDDPDFGPDSKHLRSGWSSGDVAGSNNSKWSYMEGNDKMKPRMSKEPFSGGRGSNKDDIMNKDYRCLDAKMEWEADASYSRRRSPSPKSGWSRSGSRSRSPPHGFKWDSGANDRNRTRAAESKQICRDFAVGKCRRGSHCYFLHHDDQNYEDIRESKNREDGAPRYSASHESREHTLRSRSTEACVHFAKGRCRMGASCKYVHHNNSDEYGKGTLDELTRERENDGRRRDNSFEQGGGHMPSRSGDTLCKFFANGNCRNGKHCRFSHDRQDRSLRDDRWGSNLSGDHQTLDRPKLSDSASPTRRLRSDRWGTDGIMADKDKVWDSPNRNDIATYDSAKLVEEKPGNIGATEHEQTVWPVKEGWGHSLDQSSVQGEPPFLSDKKEADHWIADNAGASIPVSQSVAADIWPGDAKMSPDWNYRAGSSTRTEVEHGQNDRGLTQGSTYPATTEHDRIHVPGQGFNQNVQNVNLLHLPSCHAVGQNQVTVPILPSRAGIPEGMQKQEVCVEKKYTAEPNITGEGSSQISSSNPSTQDTVSKEQLAQLSNLSASLAHILGSGQQLPQLYAALNSHNTNDTPSLANTEVPAMPVSNTYVKPDPAVGFVKQYDPMSDSVDLNDADASGICPVISPSKKSANIEISSLLSNTGKQNCGDTSKAPSSEEQPAKNEHLTQLQPGQNIEIQKETNEAVADDKPNPQDDHKITKENGPSENIDHNGVEANKSKDVKGIRAFKFSLVEFVKELLKPTWKEGKITKDDYKTIVKKVVDKVTGTMQGAHIPQTQEKIDHYLSFSKPKLNKLVQAYVEKVHKA